MLHFNVRVSRCSVYSCPVGGAVAFLEEKVCNGQLSFPVFATNVKLQLQILNIDVHLKEGVNNSYRFQK